jgi:hypothetical protein
MKCNIKKSQSHSFLAQPRLEIRLYLLRFTSYKHGRTRGTVGELWLLLEENFGPN